MALIGRYLIDRSAFEQRRGSARVRRLLASLLADGAGATCHLIALEVLYSARDLTDYERLRRSLLALPWYDVTTGVMDRAMDVQYLLAHQGAHRVPLPDLVIAATAEANDATVLHYDHHFEAIAEVTGQPAQWIVARRSSG